MKPVKRRDIKNFMFSILKAVASASMSAVYATSIWLTGYLKMLWLHYLLLAPLIVALVIVVAFEIREWWAEGKLKAMDEEEDKDDE